MSLDSIDAGSPNMHCQFWRKYRSSDRTLIPIVSMKIRSAKSLQSLPLRTLDPL